MLSITGASRGVVHWRTCCVVGCCCWWCVCVDVCVCRKQGLGVQGAGEGGVTAPLWNVLCCSSEMGRHEIKVEKSHKEEEGEGREWGGGVVPESNRTLTAIKGGLMRTWLGSAAQRLPAPPLAPPPTRHMTQG